MTFSNGVDFIVELNKMVNLELLLMNTTISMIIYMATV